MIKIINSVCNKRSFKAHPFRLVSSHNYGAWSAVKSGVCVRGTWKVLRDSDSNRTCNSTIVMSRKTKESCPMRMKSPQKNELPNISSGCILCSILSLTCSSLRANRS
ncbi:hypothetical protein VNO77_23613 [Canavalia gladiata]|uniref:Uncharacterized protein n=1 Tax=Canavalia gladiata TaxID=3824 RepID=A0AAN9L576_CANGL